MDTFRFGQCGIALALVFLCSCSPPSLEWVEQTEISDGFTLEVHREVGYVRGSENWFAFFASDHRLQFRHPKTNKWIHFSASGSGNPIAVDIRGDELYLAVYGGGQHFRPEHGCREIPFTFWRYKSYLPDWLPLEFGTWLPIKNGDLPDIAFKANLSYNYERLVGTLSFKDEYRRTPGRPFDEIVRRYSSSRSPYLLERVVPTVPEQWGNPYWKPSPYPSLCTTG